MPTAETITAALDLLRATDQPVIGTNFYGGSIEEQAHEVAIDAMALGEVEVLEFNPLADRGRLIDLFATLILGDGPQVDQLLASIGAPAARAREAVNRSLMVLGIMAGRELRLPAGGAGNYWTPLSVLGGSANSRNAEATFAELGDLPRRRIEPREGAGLIRAELRNHRAEDARGNEYWTLSVDARLARGGSAEERQMARRIWLQANQQFGESRVSEPSFLLRAIARNGIRATGVGQYLNPAAGITMTGPATRTRLFSDVSRDYRYAVTVGGQILDEEGLSALNRLAGTAGLARLNDGSFACLDANGASVLRQASNEVRSTLRTSALIAGDDVVSMIPVQIPENVVRTWRERLDRRPEVPETALPLKPWQPEAVQWLSARLDAGVGCMLADSMGLGKTVTALTTLSRQVGPHLVVCPPAVVDQWADEVGRFTPEVNVLIEHGSDKGLEDLDLLPRAVRERSIVVTTYARLRRDPERFAARAWGIVVADEAQALKNPSSEQGQAARRLRARARLALTGTPVENSLGDLFALLDWMNPGYLGAIERFRQRVQRPIEGYPENPIAARLRAVVDAVVLRRTKEDPEIGPHLVDKDERPSVPVTMSTRQRELTERIAEVGVQNAGRHQLGTIQRGQAVLTMIQRLKQICCHPAIVDGGDWSEGASPKFSRIMELAEDALADGRSTLIFTQYLPMVDALRAAAGRRGMPVRHYDGRMAARSRARREAVSWFQSEDEARLMIVSLRAGGAGLNLDRASCVIHADRWWNPAVEDQATDRAHRLTSTRDIQIWHLVTENSIEQRIEEVIASKRELSRNLIVASSAGQLANLSDTEIADLAGVALHRQQAPAGTRRRRV